MLEDLAQAYRRVAYAFGHHPRDMELRHIPAHLDDKPAYSPEDTANWEKKLIELGNWPGRYIPPPVLLLRREAVRAD
jgi:hypothetical protein